MGFRHHRFGNTTCVCFAFGIRFKNPPLVFKKHKIGTEERAPSAVSCVVSSDVCRPTRNCNHKRNTHGRIAIAFAIAIANVPHLQVHAPALGQVLGLGRGSWCILNNIVLIPEDF